MVDPDQTLERSFAAESQVTAGVDDEGGVAAKPLRGQVRGESLATATCIEADAGWPCHRSRNSVDRDLVPARVRARAGRLSFWGPGQSIGDALAGQVGARGGIPGVLQLVNEGRVDETTGAPRSPEGSLDGSGQGRADGAGFAELRIQSAELAVLVEAGQLAVQQPQEEFDLDTHRLR